MSLRLRPNLTGGAGSGQQGPAAEVQMEGKIARMREDFRDKHEVRELGVAVLFLLLSSSQFSRKDRVNAFQASQYFSGCGRADRRRRKQPNFERLRMTTT